VRETDYPCTGTKTAGKKQQDGPRMMEALIIGVLAAVGAVAVIGFFTTRINNVADMRRAIDKTFEDTLGPDQL